MSDEARGGAQGEDVFPHVQLAQEIAERGGIALGEGEGREKRERGREINERG